MQHKRKAALIAVIHHKSRDVFAGILGQKRAKRYQAPLTHIAYTLQKKQLNLNMISCRNNKLLPP